MQKLKKGNFHWRINQQIRASEVRVIGSNGKQVGIMKLSKALKEAYDAKLDLVEIGPNAKPPVVKIVDLGKFKYKEGKRLKKQKKGAKSSELKEIRFSPFIAEQDYKTRLEKVRGFLKEGNKIKTVVKFKGRQMGSKKFGYKLLEKILDDIDEEINIDMEPKFIGRHLSMIISPLSGGKKKEEQKPKEKQKPIKPKKEKKKDAKAKN